MGVKTRPRKPAGRIDVSLIVVAWNVAPYIAQAVQSCLDQTLKTIEIIVVENASTDGTREIIEKLIAGHPHARLVANATNTGLGPARNQGMALVRGEYFAFLDGDDWLEPDAMEAAFECAKADDADVVLYDLTRRHEDGTSQAGRSVGVLRQGLCRSFEERKAAIVISNSGCNKLYRRSFIQQESFQFTDTFYEDIDWSFCTFVLPPRLVTLPRGLLNYRLRQGSIMRSRSIRHFEIFQRWQALIDFMEANAARIDPRWRPIYAEQIARQLDTIMRSPLRGTIAERHRFAKAAPGVLHQIDPDCGLRFKFGRSLRYRALWHGWSRLAMALALTMAPAAR